MALSRVTASEGEAGPESRERILGAALDAFAENGFEGAKMRDIATRADVPLGLLQYHFGGKAKLWRAAVDRAFAQLRIGLEAIVAGTDTADASELLRRLVRSHVHFVAENPAFVRLMHDEGKRRGPRMRWMVDRHVAPLYALLAPRVEQWQSEGLLPAGIPPIHFFYLLAGAGGLIFHQAEECRRLSGTDPMDPAAVEAHARLVEHFFLGALSKETSR